MCVPMFGLFASKNPAARFCWCPAGIAESDTNGFGMERTSSAPPVQAGPMAFATTVRPFKLSVRATHLCSHASCHPPGVCSRVRTMYPAGFCERV